MDGAGMNGADGAGGGLAGKVALVTGGASGIGAGIARVLAGAGAMVAIGDLNAAAAAGVASELPGTVRRAGVPLDVTDRGSTDQAVTLVERELGAIDVLVNNAGISFVTPFLEISDTEWDRLIGVNLRGVLVVTQRVLPSMVQRRTGRIINISSMAAKEVAAHNVTVNAVCPGVVRTPLWDDPATGILRQLDGERGWQVFLSGIPLGRPQTAADIGHACAYLASDGAANVTGEALNVSGGQ